jgi:hypothetical protein
LPGAAVLRPVVWPVLPVEMSKGLVFVAMVCSTK